MTIKNALNNPRNKRRRKDPNDKKFGAGGEYEETRKQRRAEEAEERELAAAARANPDLDQSEEALVELILEALPVRAGGTAPRNARGALRSPC